MKGGQLMSSVSLALNADVEPKSITFECT